MPVRFAAATMVSATFAGKRRSPRRTTVRLACLEKGAPMTPLVDNLVERVDKLVHPGKRPAVWGDPALSVTPTSIAVHELARRVESLEHALREIALEVQKLTEQVE